jgi:hypothetical protein
MSPQWSNLVLPTNIPNSEADVFVLNSFNIKAYTHQHATRQNKTVKTYYLIHEAIQTKSGSNIVVLDMWNMESTNSFVSFGTSALTSTGNTETYQFNFKAEFVKTKKNTSETL